MRKKLIALISAGLLLTGCAASIEDTAEKCGGASAGITEDGESLKYDQDIDTTDGAWKCLLEELVPSSDDRYTITQGMQPGEAYDIDTNGYTVVYGMNDAGTIRIFFTP